MNKYHPKLQKLLEKSKTISKKTLTGKPKDSVEVFTFFKPIKNSNSKEK